MIQSEIRISKAAILANYQHFCNQNKGRVIVPVIKSDAYGHGAVDIAGILSDCGVEYLAVFNIEEAIAIREGGYTGNLWVLEGVLIEDIPIAMSLNITMACWNRETLLALSDEAMRHNRVFKIHLAVDTGMCRLGFFPDEVPSILAEIKHLHGVKLTGCFSHLACANEPDNPVTVQQVQNFKTVMAMLPEDCKEVHLCATDAMAFGYLPELPFGRLGIGLYGYASEKAGVLKPAMTFASKIISLKTVFAGQRVSYGGLRLLECDARLAVVPVGYADGYPRCLGNRMDVLVGGKRCPIYGNLCMGMMMVNVSDVPEVQVGDEVVLLGHQGDAVITADELAERAGTISYELLCALGKNGHRRVL
ncbi:MAG: alanine racemase [Lentisphaeria bacterium]